VESTLQSISSNSSLWKRKKWSVPNFDISCGQNTFFFGSHHCAAIFFSQVPKKCTHLDLSLIYILKLRTYSKFARENNFLALRALEVCFPQPCSSPGRRFAVSRSHVQSYRRIVSFPQKKFDEMHCKLDSIENLRLFEKIRRNAQPHLMVGLNNVSQRTRIS